MTNKLYRLHEMHLNGKELTILHIALTELDVRLRKGMANSGIDEKTSKLIEELRRQLNFHESDVTVCRLAVETRLKEGDT